MMVSVQISPSHPFLLVHLTEKRMRVLHNFVGLGSEPLQQCEKLALVALKLRWRCAANVGVALRHCGNAVRPRQREP